MIVRTFIAAMLEMLRRWQWNFCMCGLGPICDVLTSVCKIVSKTNIWVTWINIALQEKCLFPTKSTKWYMEMTGMKIVFLVNNGCLLAIHLYAIHILIQRTTTSRVLDWTTHSSHRLGLKFLPFGRYSSLCLSSVSVVEVERILSNGPKNIT